MQYSAWFGNRFARYRGCSRQLAVRLWRRCKELIQSHLDHHDYKKYWSNNVWEGYLVSAEPLGNVRYLPDDKDLIGVLCASFYNRLERLRQVEWRVCEIQRPPVPGQNINILYGVLMICCIRYCDPLATI